MDAELANPKESVYIEITGAFGTGHGATITINSEALDPVAYTGSHANTINLIVNELKLEPTVQDVIIIKMYTSGDPRTLIQVIPTAISFTQFVMATTGTGAPTLTQQVSSSVVDSLDIHTQLFKFVPKNPGEDSNNLIVTITPGVNGQVGYFNVNVRHKTDGSVNENYPNLLIGGDLMSNPVYLDKIKAESNYIVPSYTTGLNPDHTPLPINTVMNYALGSDGTEPDETDYIGDSNSNTGFHAFDDYDDSMEITSFDANDFYSTVAIAGTAYASNRKDLINYINLDGIQKSTLITQREPFGDNKFQYIVGGGLKLLDPSSNAQYNANVLADVFSSIARTDRDFGPWYSFAGPNRGIVNGALGVVTNFGAPAKSLDLDELANRQINMMVNKAGSVKLWGSFSGQFSNDQEKFINIERLIIYLQKSLRPTLDSFLEEPNDIPTWRRIYYTVKPFLDNLATKRAFYYYDWQGDQYVNSINDIQINNAADVSQGIYKVNLLIKPIAPIQQINVNIILAPTGVSFEIANELI